MFRYDHELELETKICTLMMFKVNSKRRNPLLLCLILVGSMAISLGELLHPLPAQQKREVRELEKCSLKLAKSECSL